MKSGQQLWGRDRGGGPTLPAIGSEKVIFGDRFKIKALDSSSGEIEWATPVGGYTARPSIGGERVYVSVASSAKEPAKLLSLNSETGQKMWETSFGNVELTKPVVANSSVFVGTNSGAVYNYS